VEREEARVCAIERTLRLYTDEWLVGLIRAALEAAHGDVVKALGEMDEHLSETLGYFGSCGPGVPRLECHGPARSTDISVWVDEPHFGRDPDLVVTWRGVFEYVAETQQIGQMRLPGLEVCHA